MRKDVKLGMAIGGGLIVLLIGYLLFAPPANNNKKGAQIAGNLNIIDQGGSGELSGGVDEKSSAPKTGADGSSPGIAHPLPDTRPSGGSGNLGSGSQPKGGDAPAKEDLKSKTGDEGSEPQDRKSSRGSTSKGHDMPAAGGREGSKPKRNEGGGEGRGTIPPSDPPRLIYNPGDPWGGGVSTDGVLGNLSSGHKVKGDLAASGKGGSDEHTTAGGTHIVKSGETLSSIAAAAYGSANHYPAILRANPGIDPNHLKLGTPLKIPALDDVKGSDSPREGKHPSVETPEVKIDPSKQYRVQPGDSLYKISMKVYGKSSYVDKIYEKNKALIGADNQRLKPSMILELPEKTATATASEREPTHSSLSDPVAEESVEK